MIIKELNIEDKQELDNYLSKLYPKMFLGLSLSLILFIMPFVIFIITSYVVYSISFYEQIYKYLPITFTPLIVALIAYYLILGIFIQPLKDMIENAVYSKNLSESDIEKFSSNSVNLDKYLLVINLLVLLSEIFLAIFIQKYSLDFITFSRILILFFSFIGICKIQSRFIHQSLFPLIELFPIFSLRNLSINPKLIFHSNVFYRLFVLIIPLSLLLNISLEFLNLSDIRSAQIRFLLESDLRNNTNSTLGRQKVLELDTNYALKNISAPEYLKKNINHTQVSFLLQKQDLISHSLLIYGVYFLLIAISYGFCCYTQLSEDRRVKKIHKRYKQLSEEDNFNEEIQSLKAPIDILDPIGELVEVYNQFITKQAFKYIQLKSTADIVLANFSLVEESIQKTQEAFLEIQSGFIQAKNASDQKSQQVQRVVLGLKETFEIFLSLSENLDKQTNMINNLSSSINSLSESINEVNSVSSKNKDSSEQLETIAKEGAKFVEESINAIKNVKISSTEVSEKISLISDISSKTNMLAINAAIESAHAGEIGKGFSVVSEEVRSLANSTSIRATQIKKNMNEMISTVNNSVNHSENLSSNLTKLVESIKTFSQDIASILEKSQNQYREMNFVSDNIHSLIDITNALRNHSNSHIESNKTMQIDLEESSQSLDFIEQSINKQVINLVRLETQIEALKQLAKDGKVISQELESLCN